MSGSAASSASWVLPRDRVPLTSTHLHVQGPTCANKPSIFSTLGGLLKTSSGVLVDIGPGLGDQLTHLTPCVDALDRVYALEPSVALHPQLRAAAKKAGLTGKYVVLPAGAQPQQMLPALEQVGVAEGDVDRVFSVFSVCSVPPAEVEPILRAVQRLLKPGGEYVFVEHVANHSDKWSAAYQWVLDLVSSIPPSIISCVFRSLFHVSLIVGIFNPGLVSDAAFVQTWPFFMGGCRLRNNMHVKLQQMPGWESVDIKPIPGSQGFEAIPFVSGRAVKA